MGDDRLDRIERLRLYSTGRVAHLADRADVERGTYATTCEHCGSPTERPPRALCGALLRDVDTDNEVEPGERHRACTRCIANLRRAVASDDTYLDTHRPWLDRRQRIRDAMQALADRLDPR